MAREGTEWVTPHRVSNVNSNGKEGSPSIARDGTLYFFSDRKGGANKTQFMSRVTSEALSKADVIAFRNQRRANRIRVPPSHQMVRRHSSIPPDQAAEAKQIFTSLPGGTGIGPRA